MGHWKKLLRKLGTHLFKSCQDNQGSWCRRGSIDGDFCVADTVSRFCHFLKFLQASDGEWARWRMPHSTSDVIADRKN